MKCPDEQYALVTAAYNEEAFIEETIVSIASQTRLPAAWIIVSDGSSDGTEHIVQQYAATHHYIHLCRVPERHDRNFAAQVNAINLGFAQLHAKRIPFNFVGNLDADISIDTCYFETLLKKFRESPNLGLAGGYVYDRRPTGTFENRRTNSPSSVAHATQFFRRECWEAIGSAYVPLPFGGPDTLAEVTARMKGWQVRSFPDLRVLHFRPTGSAGGLLRNVFRQGKMDYSLGYLPFFEIAKALKRICIKPYGILALARIAGFVHSYLRGEERAVSEEFISFLRDEQRSRLSGALSPLRRS